MRVHQIESTWPINNILIHRQQAQTGPCLLNFTFTSITQIKYFDLVKSIAKVACRTDLGQLRTPFECDNIKSIVHKHNLFTQWINYGIFIWWTFESSNIHSTFVLHSNIISLFSLRRIKSFKMMKLIWRKEVKTWTQSRTQSQAL